MSTIINTWDQAVAAGGGVYIGASYLPGRVTTFYGWVVVRVGPRRLEIPTNPSAAWYDKGRKVFAGSGSAEKRRAALVAAQDWVAAQGWYSGPWARNHMRDYVPRDWLKRFPRTA